MIITCEADKHLSEAEWSVIEYINAQQEQISKLSISDIADGAFVSNATVSRAIRKCGFNSLGELKYRLAQRPDETHSLYTVNKILSKSYQECVETLQNINVEDVLKLVEMLRSAKRVIVIANGLTALAAEEFTTYLQYQGINAWFTADANVMNTVEKLVTSEDVLVVVSVKNTMPVLARTAQRVRQFGTKVVSLCCRKGTELDKYSDLVIYGGALDMGPHLTVDTTSRIGLFIIVRTIIEYMHTEE